MNRYLTIHKLGAIVSSHPLYIRAGVYFAQRDVTGMTAPSVATTHPVEVALRRMGRTMTSLQEDGKSRIDERALLLDLDYAVTSSGHPLRSFPASFRQLHESAKGHVAIRNANRYAGEFTYVITSVQQTIENSIAALVKA